MVLVRNILLCFWLIFPIILCAQTWFKANKEGVITDTLKDAPYTPLVQKPNQKKTVSYMPKYQVATKEAKLGILNKQKSWLISPYFDSLFICHDNLFIVYKYGKWTSIDTLGNEYAYGEDHIYCYDETYTLIQSKTQFGALNTFGERTLPTVYDSITTYKKNWLKLWKAGKTVFMDIRQSSYPKMNAYQSFRYISNLDTASGWLGVCKGHYCGYIDFLGRLRISLQYDSVLAFSDGRGAFKLQNKWGFIDASDQIIIQPNYDYVEPFSFGQTRVSLDRKYGLIDTEGNYLISPVYDTIYTLKTQNWIVKQGKRKGFVDKDFSRMTSLIFEDIKDFGNGYIAGGRKGKYGVYTYDGINVLSIDYHSILLDTQDTSFYLLRLE